MFQRILVPLDGSELSETALPTAVRLARASGGLIVLLRVVNPPTEYAGSPAYPLYTPIMLLERVIEEDLADAQHYLEKVATSAMLAGVRTQLEVHVGLTAPLIFSLVDSEHIDVIVMSSHGRNGFKRWLLGSVTEKVVKHASVPVLVLRGQEVTAIGQHPYVERPLRILVPLDGSVLARTALGPALHLIAALAAPGSGAIHLVRIVKNDRLPGEKLDAETREQLLHKAKTYLQSVTGHLCEGLAAQLHIAVTWSVALDNDAAAGIIGVAENGEDAEGAGIFGGCDLIALATHGRSGLQRWAMGSVAERVLTRTRLPVLVVRPQQTNGEHQEGDTEKQHAEMPM